MGAAALPCNYWFGNLLQGLSRVHFGWAVLNHRAVGLAFWDAKALPPTCQPIQAEIKQHCAHANQHLAHHHSLQSLWWVRPRLHPLAGLGVSALPCTVMPGNRVAESSAPLIENGSTTPMLATAWVFAGLLCNARRASALESARDFRIGVAVACRRVLCLVALQEMSRPLTVPCRQPAIVSRGLLHSRGPPLLFRGVQACRQGSKKKKKKKKKDVHLEQVMKVRWRLERSLCLAAASVGLARSCSGLRFVPLRRSSYTGGSSGERPSQIALGRRMPMR